MDGEINRDVARSEARAPYYAKDGMVWKHPVYERKGDGGATITIGFPVCTLHEAVGSSAADAVAGLMNQGERFDAMLEALKITAGNIRSLGPAGALDAVPTPYREWLKVVDDAIAAAERLPA